MQLHLGPSDWELLGRTTCELLISVPPASDLGSIHGEFLTFSEWWMDKSVHNHFWAWSSTLVLPLPSCSYHLEKMEGKQEALPSPGRMWVKGATAQASTPNSFCLPYLPASCWLNPWPPDASLCPPGGHWGEVFAVTKEAIHRHLPVPDYSRRRLGPFHLQSRGFHPFGE